MIQHHPLASLPVADRGWLRARFHFVAAGMGMGPANSLGPLIAWNDDEIAPNSGFPEHPHDNVEIVTFVRDGAITHRDTLGNIGRAAAGQAQVMSAGSGLRHVEVNADAEPVRLFQIWIETRSRDVPPCWAMTGLPAGPSSGGFVLLASGRDGDVRAARINADARVLGARLEPGETLRQPLTTGRAYLVPTKAGITVNRLAIGPRDGCRVEGAMVLEITAVDATEILLVELI